MSLFLEKVPRTFVSSIKKTSLQQPMEHNNNCHLPASGLVLALRKTLSAALMVLFCSNVFSQGWELYFGGPNEDFGHSIIQAQNQDYLIAGYSESFNTDLSVYVVRTDVDGRMIWQKTYDEGHIEHGYSIIETDDNAFLIVGDIIPVPQVVDKNVYLLKIDGQGELLWTKQFGGSGNETGWRVIPSANNGGYVLVGKTSSFGNGGDDAYVIKVDADGNQVWFKTYGSPAEEEGRSIVETTDGYLVLGTAFNPANNSKDIYLIKIDFDGNLIWQKFFGSNGFDEGHDIKKLADGNFAFTGINELLKTQITKVDPDGEILWSNTVQVSNYLTNAFDLIQVENDDLVLTGVVEIPGVPIPANSHSNILIGRFTNDGDEIWLKNIGRTGFFDWGQSIVRTADKGFAIAGFNAEQVSLFNDVTFVKANANGDLYTNHLAGKVFIDENADCSFNTAEAGLNQWFVTAKSPDKTFFGTSDAQGNYDIILDEGTYSVSVFVKNRYWESCVASYNVTFTAQYDTLTRNFPITKSTLCPLLEVDVSAPVVQNCSNIGYAVSYCNNGTVPVPDPTVEVVLDENLALTGASIPFTQVGDSLLVFDIGPLGVDECGSFQITATSSCNGLPFEAYTVGAHILPDSICLPTIGWDLSDIRVNGYCDADSVRFEIINDGDSSMQAPLNFVVIQDQVLALTGEFLLGAHESIPVKQPATGSTYRLIAQQAAGHPGNSYPTIAIEGCSTSGDYSTGYVTEMQENENDPFVSIDVQEAVSPTDYIFMRGYPKGYLENGDRLIEANTPLQYHIYFQNPGTDTIQHLVIRDTLPESLDLATVVPGASSHPYRFEAYSNGVLRFTFDDLNLSPGSGAASNGFVQFKVNQKPNNPDGTVIPNSAAVFLGYEVPAQTATVLHKIGRIDPLIQLVNWVSEPNIPGTTVHAYPNPFTSSIVFEIKENQNRFKLLTLTVFDMSGRLVRQEKAAGHQLQLERGNLLAGLYSFRLEADGLPLSTGKFIVR